MFDYCKGREQWVGLGEGEEKWEVRRGRKGKIRWCFVCEERRKEGMMATSFGHFQTVHAFFSLIFSVFFLAVLGC